MSDSRGRLERVGGWLITGSIGLVQFKLSVAQILGGLALLIWLRLVIQEKRFVAPPFFWALVAYAALTLASAAVSIDPHASFIDSRQLLLFLMVPVAYRLLEGDRAGRASDIVIWLGSVAAIVGVVQYLLFGYDNEQKRLMGPLGHWMTYSGVLMLVLVTALAKLLYAERRSTWPAIAVPALVAALGMTLTRSVYLGALVALAVLLLMRSWKALAIAPIAAVILYFIAPGAIQQRVNSIWDPNNPTNRDRVAMWQVGAGMVRAHPLFGVGPEMVQREYVRFRPPVYVQETNFHLHNVPVQIAAERGLPALAAWLVFIGIAVRDLLRMFARGGDRTLAAAGVGAIAAMLTAGLFEYNFGDSEFLMLFLGLITLPFAAARRPEAAATMPRPSPAPVPVLRARA